MTINQKYRVAELQRGQWWRQRAVFWRHSRLVVLHLPLFCSALRQRRMDRQPDAARALSTLLHRLAIASSAIGYWLAIDHPKFSCADGEACARPLPNRAVKPD